MKRENIVLKRLIIMVVMVITSVFCLAACGAQEDSNSDYEQKSDNIGSSSNTSNEVVSNELSASQLQVLEDTFDEYLGDIIIESSYEDGTYYVFVAMDSVDDADILIESDFDDALNGLTETVHKKFSVDCAIFVMDGATKSELLYVSSNGIDFTDFMK